VEDGEDLQELINRAHGKKEQCTTNKLLKETDMPGYSIPVSDLGVKVEISQWGM
jgi:hypothetical protein